MALTLRQNLRLLPASAWILFLGSFINRFGTFVQPFLVIYLTRQGYSVARAGLAAGAYGAGHLASAILGGHLADRIGRRNTITLSMFCGAASMLALSQARGFPLMVALTALAGTAGELYRPASIALLSDLVGAGQRVTAFSMYRLAVNLGFAAGPAVAGFLADRSFLYIFLGDAATSCAFGAVALLALPHGLRTVGEGERWNEAWTVIRHDRRFLTFLAATVFVTVVDFQMLSTFALHVRANGFPAATYGMLISLNGVLIVLFELAITAVTQRFPPRPVIALGYLLSGLGFALTGFAHTVPALAATVVLWTLGEMVSSPVAVAYVSRLAPVRYRGRYMGTMVLAWSAGMIVGPSLGTAIFGYHPWLVWLLCGICGLVAALLAVREPPDHGPSEPGTAA
jgi:MFS family permease